MARQLNQLSALQDAFAARIRAKVHDRRTQVQEHTGDIPLLGWLLKPLAGLAFDAREGRNRRQGEHGEEGVPTEGIGGYRRHAEQSLPFDLPTLSPAASYTPAGTDVRRSRT